MNFSNGYAFERGNAAAILLIILGLVLAGGSVYYYLQPTEEPTDEIVKSVEAPVIDTVEETVTEVVSKVPVIDFEAALAPRYLGSPEAPVRIVEFSSLSCGHCAKFHETTLKDLYKNYIFPGSVYIEFSDFPLNKPALEATMIARCLPADKYVTFTDELFAKQEEWLVEDYTSVLKQYAAAHDMDEATFEACLASDELRNGIVARVEAAQKQFEVTSTPTFLINNKEVVKGAQPVKAFAEKVDVLLEMQ